MERGTELLLEVLRRALAEPGEYRLFKSGKLDGLFPSRAGSSGDTAAQALRDGLLAPARTETKGKTTIEWVRVTPRGVEYLHEHESPLHALHELRAALAQNQEAIPRWLDALHGDLQSLQAKLAADAQQWTERLDALGRRVEEALSRLEATLPLLPADVAEAVPWGIDALNYLDRRQSGGAANDCPLPELFLAVVGQHAGLSVMDFHAGLRRLHERRALRLSTGNGSGKLEQPEYALLEGGKVFYYAAR